MKCGKSSSAQDISSFHIPSQNSHDDSSSCSPHIHSPSINWHLTFSHFFKFPLNLLRSNHLSINQIFSWCLFPIIFYFRISMSLQVKSNQFLYNILELTHRKKYTRVIRICEYLESQGILSHQFVIVKSYALAHTKGYSEALRYLQPFEGLLINAAKIQYQQMQDMYLESVPLFDTLTTAQGSSILEQLRDNNQILAGNGKLSIQQIICRGEEDRCARFIINKKEEEVVGKVNEVSEDYEQQKKLLQDGLISKDAFNHNCLQFISKYKQIASHYRVKGKIKDLIEQYIMFLTKLAEGTI